MSAKERESADTKDLLGRKKGFQSRAHVGSCPQAARKRRANLGESSGQLRAVPSTFVLERLETVRNFLSTAVSEVNQTWELAKTYGGKIRCGVSDPVVCSPARKRLNGGVAGGDGTGKLVDEFRRAFVVLAAVEFGNDGVTVSAEAGESVLDVRGCPLCDHLGDNTGEGHSTGSKDAEDDGETHDEEV